MRRVIVLVIIISSIHTSWALFWNTNSAPVPVEVEVLYLRHHSKNKVKKSLPIVLLGHEWIVYKTRATALRALFRLGAFFGTKPDEISVGKYEYAPIEKKDAWIESSFELTASHYFDKRFLGMLVGCYLGYRLGLHGPGLQSNDQTCLHSVAGKISLSSSRTSLNKFIVGVAFHINKLGKYIYAEQLWDKFPIEKMAVGVGMGIGPGEQKAMPEIFVKIPLGHWFGYVCLPTLKIGVTEGGRAFLRFGSE
jgi:hypothetical protein